MLEYEKKLYAKGYKSIAGLDEAGRGCLAGPLVVAICVLPMNYVNNEIKDSKKITRNKRFKIYQQIIQEALYYDYVIYDSHFVDLNNPKKSSIIGMEYLINKACNNIDFALIDAEKLENINIKSLSIIKGDSLSQSIAAASIIAKTIRDMEMKKLDQKYPQYGFSLHQGYGTKLHLEKLKEFGPIRGIHRFSYKPIKKLSNNIKFK